MILFHLQYNQLIIIVIYTSKYARHTHVYTRVDACAYH